MKQESMPRFLLRISLTLLVITSVMAAALALTNAITKPKIEQHTQAKTLEAIEAVLPGGGEEIFFSDKTGMVKKVYASDLGYAVQVESNGFDGPVTMMVGVDKAGKVLGISIISHTETAGLGAVAAADTSAGKQFRQQFAGVSGNVSVSKDGGEIDAITGATITSKGICNGVNAALECVSGLS